MTTDRLDDLCELIIDCPHFTPEWTTSGYVVVRNQNIRDGRLDLSQPSYTHETDFLRRIRRAKPREGDIIFTREAPMGEVCLVPPNLECCVGQRQVLLRPKREVSSQYLFAALRSKPVRDQIFWNEGTGSTVSNVRIPVLKSLKIPRLGDQETAIGELLGALDDKVEANRRMNETLESIGRALFKSWFVDFDPVGAKAEGRQSGLAADLDPLFPSSFEAISEVPNGWQAADFDLYARPAGETVSAQALTDETPYIALEHMPRRSVVLSDWEGAGDLGSNKARFREGDTLFGKLRPYFHKVGLALFDGVCSTDIVVLRPTAPRFRAMTLFAASSDAFVSFVDVASTGTKMPRTNWARMKQFQVVDPGREVAEAFEQIASPVLARIKLNTEQSRTLAALRDLLLPKLMSGAIRVRDAQAMLEAVQ